MIAGMQARLLATAAALALIAGANVMADAQANVLPALPLQPGRYASEEFDCKDAPFAGLFFYDGQNVSGPHTSGCVSRTMSIHTNPTGGTVFEVSTACSRNGDGSPAAPTRFREIYRVLSATKTERADAASPSITHIYRWCAPSPVRK
jgi:hypothetical protein